MKKYIITLCLVVGLGTTIVGCRDYLDSDYIFDERMSIEQVFQSKDYTNEWLARTVERSQLLAAGAVLPENLAASAASLTERPRRVLDLMMDGMNDAAIAERLNLSERTVQVYRAQIYKAYGVHSVKQFALLIPRLKAALSSADADS